MANRNFQPVRALTKEQIHLVGVVNLTTSGAVVSTDFDGLASFVRTGAGAYTLTLQDAFSKVLGLNISLLEATPTALQAKFLTANPATKVYTINVLSGATPTDTGAATQLHIRMALKNSTAK